MSLQGNIRHVLSIIQKAVSQAPLDKQPLLNNKIARVVGKYHKVNNESNQASYLKQLQFNLNFIKLSFPNLDYSPPKQPPTQPVQNQVNQSQARGQFFQLDNQEEVDKFIKETENVLKGVREQVQFTNWGAGNVDPQDLKRHKELLKRQYFGGDFWKDRPQPVSPSAAYLVDIMQNHPQMRNQKIEVQQTAAPQFSHNPDQNWEKVKR